MASPASSGEASKKVFFTMTRQPSEPCGVGRHGEASKRAPTEGAPRDAALKGPGWPELALRRLASVPVSSKEDSGLTWRVNAISESGGESNPQETTVELKLAGD